MKMRIILLVAMAVFVNSCQLDSSTKELAPNYILLKIDEGPYRLNQDGGAWIVGDGITAYAVQGGYIFLRSNAKEKKDENDPMKASYAIVKILPSAETETNVRKGVEAPLIKPEFDSIVRGLGIVNFEWETID